MGKIFYLKHALTPIAIPHIQWACGNESTTYRVLCVFGIRIAAWSTVNWDAP